MAELNESTKQLAATIFSATIAAHYNHGLERGLKLNLKQIAGESVEAAMTLNLTIRAEEEHGAVTQVMQTNAAFAQGFVCGKSNDSEALGALIEQSPEHRDSLQRGWVEGRKGAGVPAQAN